MGVVALHALRWVYVAWMVLVFPIGWCVFQVSLAILYFGVFTPIGWIMRILGCHPLHLKPDLQATSYWIPTKSRTTPDNIFVSIRVFTFELVRRAEVTLARRTSPTANGHEMTNSETPEPVKSEPSEIEKLAAQPDPGIIAEFWEFLAQEGKWWLIPILIVLLLLGVLAFLSTTDWLRSFIRSFNFLDQGAGEALEAAHRCDPPEVWADGLEAGMRKRRRGF